MKRSITGYSDYLYTHMVDSFKKAKRVDIIVSFLMESGVRLLEAELKDLKKRQVPIRILTGNYLNITQPSALYLLKEFLGDTADLRFFNEPKRSFHAKCYFFQYEDGAEMYIGSSNLSKSAFTNGVEWNFRLDKKANPIEYTTYQHTFEDLFLNHAIRITDEELDYYSKNWRRNKIYSTVKLQSQLESVAEPSEPQYNVTPIPRGAQIEALYYLNKARQLGKTKGLIVAATGIGKTYLAAFDSTSFKKVLFVAHREEILNQAEESFKRVRPAISTGFYTGSSKDTNVDLMFASVQTLGKEETLNQFDPAIFDYIVIDECHHAAATSYQNILNYFKPKFLLGLTATPNRLDNADIFELFGDEVIYEINLTTAINQGMLVPFRYYAVYDETIDYDKIEIQNNKYKVKDLEEALSIHQRAELILKHYQKYQSTRAMGFCISKSHAEFMAEYFTEHGISCCSVYSGEQGSHSLVRQEAISKLEAEEINIIFSVDMFNEGVDIKPVDLVMLLRPTESPTIFLQQLGRGLRLHENKNYLNVLDFIGNYKKANLIPYLLTGCKEDSISSTSVLKDSHRLPQDCLIDFDFKIIDIFEKLDRKDKLFEQIKSYYTILKQSLNGSRPTRIEFYQFLETKLKKDISKPIVLTIFKDYLSFLHQINELTLTEKELLETKAHEFIQLIETTGMQRYYKIPLLNTFFSNDGIQLTVTREMLIQSVENFYQIHKIDFKQLPHPETSKAYSNAVSQPIEAFCKTNPEMFFYDKITKQLSLTSELENYINHKEWVVHLKDAVEFQWIKHLKRING